MYIRKKKYPSGNIGTIVVEKTSGKVKGLTPIGFTQTVEEVDHLIAKGRDHRLLADYTDERVRKDAYNRDKGIRRLGKAYSRGTLTKEFINKRGYNK